jgi:hypothetical protein
MKSLLILKVGKSAQKSQTPFIDWDNVKCNFFEALTTQDVYKLSFKCDWDMVIINKGLEDVEEENLISFLNEKNSSTVFIPYTEKWHDKIKKRIKKLYNNVSFSMCDLLS